MVHCVTSGGHLDSQAHHTLQVFMCLLEPSTTYVYVLVGMVASYVVGVGIGSVI